MIGSTPSLLEFDPRTIPFQAKLIKDIRHRYDYSTGPKEILLSGAMGSSKSTVAAHLALTHAMLYPRSRVLVGRRTLASLKDTFTKKIQEHIGNDLVEHEDYVMNKSRHVFTFRNGSEIIPYSWADGNIKKVRSMELSAAVIEELTENEDLEFYKEILLRVRLQHVPEKWVLSCTNPDDPSHPAYDYFIGNPTESRHVYYSKTSDNPFLDPTYIRKLEETLDEKMARRLLYGEWLAVRQDVIYYSYSPEHNFIKRPYEINKSYPIHINWDFNIGIGKPLSLCLFQYINGVFHVFDEVIIEGARTEDALEELYGRGYFDLDVEFEIHGDATGKHRSTASKHSDWDIVKHWLNNCKRKGTDEYVRFKMGIPLSNPKVRQRHNNVNAQLHNSIGQRRLFVYGKCKVTDEGLRLTKLKENAGYVEDDSKAYQHVTTALGYGVCWVLSEIDKPQITMLR